MQLAKFLTEVGFCAYPVVAAVGLVNKEGEPFLWEQKGWEHFKDS